MKGRRVRFTAAAHRHFTSKRLWWIKNRDYSELFATELERSLRILSILPGVGASQGTTKSQVLRRLLVRKIACHVYYTFDDHQVVVRAVWGARRERGPSVES